MNGRINLLITWQICRFPNTEQLLDYLQMDCKLSDTAIEELSFKISKVIAR